MATVILNLPLLSSSLVPCLSITVSLSPFCPHLARPLFLVALFFLAVPFYPVDCEAESSRVHIPDTATNARNDIRFEAGTHDSVISCRTRSPGVRSTQTADPDYVSPCIFERTERHASRHASCSSC